MIDNTKVTQADIRIISNRLAWVNSSIFTSISRACAILNTQSQKILLKLTKKGLSRQEAYSIVQKNAMEAWNNKRNFYDVLKTDNKLLKYLSIEELKNILEINTTNSKIDWIFKNKIK